MCEYDIHVHNFIDITWFANFMWIAFTFIKPISENTND